jgi:DNA-binding MarR family transcriptional regulator
MLEIYEMPGHLVRRLNQAATALFIEEATKAGYDMTPVQYGALAAIREWPGLDQATLAAHIAYDRVTIGGVVDRLVQKGLITRQVSRKDRRARELYLTDAGKIALDLLRPFVLHMQELLLEGLTESERSQFIDLLKKAVNAANDQSRAPLRVEQGE